MWPKFGNFSMSMRGVIIASILEVLLVELQWFVAGTMYGLVILCQCRKRVKFKSQKVFVANPYVCRSYRGSTGRGEGLFASFPILNRVNIYSRCSFGVFFVYFEEISSRFVLVFLLVTLNCCRMGRLLLALFLTQSLSNSKMRWATDFTPYGTFENILTANVRNEELKVNRNWLKSVNQNKEKTYFFFLALFLNISEEKGMNRN